MTTATKPSTPNGHARRGSFDVPAIHAAASNRWTEILPAVTGIPVDVLDGKHHPCPKCGGTDRFRLIDKKLGAVLCSKCFSEKNGDGFATI